ncbi:maleylacetoacetate isomerase [Pusillimonas sp. T2]|uniref:maleylacetoacetate isomerase n=1 Tax=Pusillimonas sp. T2 TaxID=1548123 RepID=UPI000B9CFC05|nr:maleylacetoacetate isomerase [Pusillimonas sp. T2]OXR49482.1 maleylacetoacetate isomerase [Pusillimonas sp. T2]
MKLYTYFRSSAAYRVRIALNLKGLAFETSAVHLLRAGGEQKTPEYRAINPLGVVPSIEIDNGVITQSLAIIEWLEESYPRVPLLPTDAAGRARVRAIAQTIACEIHPLNNLRVLKYLTDNLGVTEQQKKQWYQHWVREGLLAVENMLATDNATGTFCHGETPGIADCCLVPQIFNARRFGCELLEFPTITRIVEACESLAQFNDASPERQPDAE